MTDEESASISTDLSNLDEPLDTDVMSLAPSTTTISAAVTTTRSSNFLYIVEPLANITINSGKEVRIKCHVKGNPPPKFRWFKNEAPFESERRGRITIRKEHDGSKIRIRNLDVPDTGYYRCEASNGFEKVETTGIIKVLMVPGKAMGESLDLGELETGDYPELTHISEEADSEMTLAGASVRAPDFTEPGVCQPYKGTACAKFLQNTTVFISGSQTISQIEDGLIAAFSMVPKHTELSSQCTEYAVPSLCYHMFPVCEDGSANKQPRQLCRDECELLESEICRKEYAVANAHPVLKEFTPDCHRLPTDQSIEHRKCIRLGLRPSTSKQAKLTKEECYTGDGHTYAGMHQKTVSGAECRKWDGVNYPEMAHHNFCRNPNGLHPKPWCYNGRTDEVEPCNMQKCARPAEDFSMNNFLYIAGASGALLLLVLLVSLGMCIRRRSHKRQRKEAFKANIKTNPLELNALIPKYQIHGHVPEIQMENVRFLDVMGDGTFGKVYAGDLTADGCTRPVIVRLIREASSKTKQDFQREMSTWSDYRHPNVAMLIGAHTSKDPFVMLFEHSTYGDLHEHLEAMADRSTKSLSNMDSGNATEYLHMATQVAAGLEFLAGNCYVHRDVAAKNCWVFENGSVKVADHGVGPSRYPMDYSIIGNHVLPIRWMAPESINYGQSTLHSAVWSFGVLMWEIWTEGMQPYYGCTHQEILEMIRTRQLLAQPEDAPANIYALMVECWHENPVRRPSFKELHQRLYNWEHGRLIGSGQQDAAGNNNNPGRSRSTVSQHSSNGPQHSSSNNTGSTHISNGFQSNLPSQFTFSAAPNSPAFSTKFGSSFPRRQPAAAASTIQTQTGGAAGLTIVPPSPLLRGSALSTPQFRGPRFNVNNQPQLPAFNNNNNLNFDSFRTTNL